MANSWLRLWHDMPNDPKWRTIARVSKQSIPAVLSVYVHLLVIASNATERGRTQNVCSEDLASALDLEADQVDAILTAMQGRVLDGDMVSGWAKRQVEREDGSAERAKRWRESQKEAKRTQANAGERKQTPDTDTDTDKSKEAQAPLPDWIPAEAWAGYVEMRKRIRKPMTQRAKKLVLSALAGMQAKGLSVAQALDNSTRNSWVDVYEPKEPAGAVGGLKRGTDEYAAIHKTADWWRDAGFESVWDADASKCWHDNAHQFREGKRAEVTQ